MDNENDILENVQSLKEKIYKNISKDNENLIIFLDIFSNLLRIRIV